MDRSLHVIMPVIADQKWSCHSCGDCCRTLVGHLFEHERMLIQRQGWEQELGVEPVVRLRREWVLNKRQDGACIFLDEQNRCLIHARHGENAKPLACRIFPFSVRPVDGGWQASLRFDCPSVLNSSGAPLRQHLSLLLELAEKLPHRGHHQRKAALPGRLEATDEEIELLLGRLERMISVQGNSLTQRWIVGARVTHMLSQAKLGKVRGKRFGELIDILVTGLGTEYEGSPADPTARQCGMLRQLVFAHCEHVDIAVKQSSWRQRMGKKLSQLRKANQFLKGKGNIPWMPHGTLLVSFSAIESVEPCADRKSAEGLLNRYCIARLRGRSVFGGGYYDWPVTTGLNALWLAIAVIGWLARYSAACRGATSLTFDDIAKAVSTVDRAATRLPALGTRAERGRIAFVSADDGVARLLHRYRLVD